MDDCMPSKTTLRFPLRIDNQRWWGRLRAKADANGLSLHAVIIKLLEAWLRGDVSVGVTVKSDAA